MKSRKILIRLLIISALCAVLTVSAFAREKSALFADVYSDDWYAPAAEYCYRNYIMYPDPDLNFNANRPVSRAGVVDALWQTLSQPQTLTHHSFADVAILTESWDHQAALDPMFCNMRWIGRRRKGLPPGTLTAAFIRWNPSPANSSPRFSGV